MGWSGAHRHAIPYLDLDAELVFSAAMTTEPGRRQLRAAIGWAAIWLVTRLLLVWVVIARPGTQQDVRGDVRLYDGWSAALLHGSTAPFADARWQYPPGAALVMAGPRLLPFSYLTSFLVLALVTDALVTLLLWRRGGPMSDARTATVPRGAAYWIVGVALLGPVVISRFDIAPSAAAVAAMLSPAVVGGLLIGAGAGVKLWPGLLAFLPNCRRGIERSLAQTIAVVVGVLLVTLPVVALDAGMATAALRHQASRGLQIESIAASPFVVAHMLGLSSAAGYSYGAFQIVARRRQRLHSLRSLSVRARSASSCGTRGGRSLHQWPRAWCLGPG